MKNVLLLSNEEVKFIKAEGYAVISCEGFGTDGINRVVVEKDQAEDAILCIEYVRNKTKGLGTIHFNEYLVIPKERRGYKPLKLSEFMKLINSLVNKNIPFACQSINELYHILYHQDHDESISKVLKEEC